MVYVIDIQGRPLMPTERHRKVRRLLRDGLARVVTRTPFTIQLLYETTPFVQPVTLGLDPGSKVAGLSASTKDRELIRVEASLRTDIVGLLSTRRELRRTRRSRMLRHRKARFDNRKKPDNLMAPSIEQRIDSHMKLVNKACSILPVSRIIVETAQFDMQLIKNPDISGTDYQHGEQEGWKNVREYVLWRDGHSCRSCGGKSKDFVLEVHHLESRKTGGNSPDNLVTLCKACHEGYHRGDIQLKLKHAPSLRDAVAVNIFRWEIYNRLVKAYGKDKVGLIYGYKTKDRRISLSLPKTSETDAFCIAGNLDASRCDLIKAKFVARHCRSLHRQVTEKGGKRRGTVTSHWIGKSYLQRFDTVKYQGKECIISGSTNGRPILRNIDWTKATDSPSVNPKQVKFLSRKHDSIIYKTFTNKQIITCET